MRKFVWGALALACAATASVAAPLPMAASPETVGFDGAKLELLNEAMDKAVTDGNVAGIEIMAARHGRIVDLHGFGMASVGAGTRIARDTIFRMYSQTKPMIGVAMMILY